MSHELVQKMSFSKTQEFVKKVYENTEQIEMRRGETIPLISMPVDAKPLVDADTKPSARERRANAALLYVFAEGDPEEKYKTLDDIGKLYGVGREQIRMDIRNHLSDLASISTPDIQLEYPSSQLAYDRRPRRIRGILEGRSRRTLWITREYRRVVGKMSDPETTRTELQALIKSFNNHDAVRRYSRGDDPVLIILSDLQKKAWGNKNHHFTKEVYKMLEAAGIPVHAVFWKSADRTRKLSISFTLIQTFDDALKVLSQASESFKGNRVRQLAGTQVSQDQYPSTTVMFDKRRGYTHVTGLGKDMRNKIINSPDFTSRCPVKVWGYEGSGVICVQTQEIKAFMDFISEFS